MKETKKKRESINIIARNLILAFLVLLVGGITATKLLCKFWGVCF